MKISAYSLWLGIQVILMIVDLILWAIVAVTGFGVAVVSATLLLIAIVVIDISGVMFTDKNYYFKK